MHIAKRNPLGEKVLLKSLPYCNESVGISFVIPMCEAAD